MIGVIVNLVYIGYTKESGTAQTLPDAPGDDCSKTDERYA